MNLDDQLWASRVVEKVEVPQQGDKVEFGCRDWEVISVELVDCNYDAAYQYRVTLARRDREGKVFMVATGIPNYCLDKDY